MIVPLRSFPWCITHEDLGIIRVTLCIYHLWPYHHGHKMNAQTVTPFFVGYYSLFLSFAIFSFWKDKYCEILVGCHFHTCENISQSDSFPTSYHTPFSSSFPWQKDKYAINYFKNECWVGQNIYGQINAFLSLCSVVFPTCHHAQSSCFFSGTVCKASTKRFHCIISKMMQQSMVYGLKSNHIRESIILFGFPFYFFFFFVWYSEKIRTLLLFMCRKLLVHRRNGRIISIKIHLHG